MPNRPLLILPAPGAPAKRKNKHGGDSTPHLPGRARQIERLEPAFEELQRISGLLQVDANGTVPEKVLVVEIVGEIEKFIIAVQHVGMEWLGDFEEEDIPPDDDFFAVNDKDERKPDTTLRGRLFLVLTNQRALNELLSLWRRWKAGNDLPIGLRKWKDVFERLRAIRPWGVQDRLRETGVLLDWRERLDHNQEVVPCEIELWFRQDQEHRRGARDRVRTIVNATGGEVLNEAVIEEIRYHALFAKLPIASVAMLISQAAQETELVQCEQIQFFRAAGQMIVDMAADESVPEEPIEAAPESTDEPIVALLDGLPLQNHQQLVGRLRIDDPDNFEAHYSAGERRHGTAMASLILNGDLSGGGNPLSRPIYVRPILIPDQRDWQTRQEAVPENTLVVDLVHRAVRRIFEGEGQQPPAAPGVCILSLSIGIRDRLFDGSMSPLARLLDWLAWRYQVLFIVSAGNHLGSVTLPMSRAELTALTPQQIQTRIIQAIAADARHRRLLSPAEAVNVITVGAVHADESIYTPSAMHIAPFVDAGLPSPINAQGMGYRRAIKPELLAPGGKILYAQDLTTNPHVQLDVRHGMQAPGLKVAAPGSVAGGLSSTWYTRGTSPATALTSRAGAILCDVLDDLRHEPGGDLISTAPRSVWIKALLAHGADWGPAGKVLNQVLRNSKNSRQFREYLTRLLGYGAIDVNRVSECTAQRVTALGGGTLTDGQAHIHLFPLPPSLSNRTGYRRLVVTLAWLTPINARHQKWRRADLWFTPNLEKISVARKQADNKASQRGTIQHEVMEGDDAIAFVDGDNIEVHVNCRADAGVLEEPVPYALAVTLQVAEEIGVNIYDEVRVRLQPRVTVVPNI